VGIVHQLDERRIQLWERGPVTDRVLSISIFPVIAVVAVVAVVACGVGCGVFGGSLHILASGGIIGIATAGGEERQTEKS
jgi:hypothetical protein